MAHINDAGIITGGVGGQGVTLYKRGTTVPVAAGAGLGGFIGPTAVAYQQGSTIQAYDWTTGAYTQLDGQGANTLCCDPSGWWAAGYDAGFSVRVGHLSQPMQSTPIPGAWRLQALSVVPIPIILVSTPNIGALALFDSNGVKIDDIASGPAFSAVLWDDASIGWQGSSGAFFLEGGQLALGATMPQAASLSTITVASVRYLLWNGVDGYGYTQTVNRPGGDLIARFGNPQTGTFYPSMNASLLTCWGQGSGDQPVASQQLTAADFVPVTAPIVLPTFAPTTRPTWILPADQPQARYRLTWLGDPNQSDPAIRGLYYEQSQP